MSGAHFISGLHEEYVRVTPGAKSAVVFIHGILSTPRFFEKLVMLVPEEYSVYNVMLDGHGGGVKDFSDTSMKIWKHQIKTLVNYLSKQYDEIIMVGHSMGTLFSIQNAVAHPEKIKALFLLCTPLKVLVHPRSAKYSLRIVLERPHSKDPVEASARHWYSIGPEKNLLKYIPWMPKFASLLNEIRKTRKLAPKISIPTRVFHAKYDSLVSGKATSFFKNNENIHITNLHNSYHQYFTDEDYKIIMDSFAQLFLK